MHYTRGLRPTAWSGLGARGSPICSACLFPPCRLPYPGGPTECLWPFLPRSPWPSPSLQRLGIHMSPAVGSRGGCVTRLQSSLHATARQDCWPFTDKDGYTRAFARRVAPKRASGITMRANSQFPQPDLHRQDMRPYGLHAKRAQAAKEPAVFKGLARRRAGERPERFWSGCPPGLMRVGESLRSLHAAHRAACLAGASPAAGIGCLPA